MLAKTSSKGRPCLTLGFPPLTVILTPLTTTPDLERSIVEALVPRPGLHPGISHLKYQAYDVQAVLPPLCQQLGGFEQRSLQSDQRGTRRHGWQRLDTGQVGQIWGAGVRVLDRV